MRLKSSWFAVAVVLLPLASGGVALAESRTFSVVPGESRVQFVSDAPLEKFTGTSDKVTGIIKTDPDNAGKSKAELKVEVASIKTGVKLRDEHLRGEDWLDAKRHPHAKFVVTRVEGLKQLKPNETAKATVYGKFFLHGVTRDVKSDVQVRLTSAPGEPDQLRVVGSFKVKLEDHKVSVPSIVALKVAPELEVNIDIRAKAKK
jgi:polyisoprenoid-binding protein YceI